MLAVVGETEIVVDAGVEGGLLSVLELPELAPPPQPVRVTPTIAAKITREASDVQSFLAISDIFGGKPRPGIGWV